MTDPRHRLEHAPDIEDEPSPEVLQLAAKVFDLARQGDTATVAAYVDAGVLAPSARMAVEAPITRTW